MAEGDDIYQSWANDYRQDQQRRAQRPAPSFTKDMADRISQGKRQGQYETGNPAYDNFLRAGMGGQPPQSEDQRYYRDPQAFTGLMQDMYEAGTYDDPQALQMIQNKYRGSPLQPLMMRAYQEGRQSRRRRAPQRSAGM